MKNWNRLILACALPAVAACGLGDLTEGELGRLSFGFPAAACLVGCDIERPVMVGSTETYIAFGADVPPEAEVVSSRPGVLEVQRVRQETFQGERAVAFDVLARRAGAAQLQVLGGSVVDTLTVEAREPTGFAFQRSVGGPDGTLMEDVQSLRLTVGEEVLIRPVPLAGDVALQASTGISGGLVRDVAVALASPARANELALLRAVATAAGENELRVQARGVSGTLSILVEPATSQ